MEQSILRNRLEDICKEWHEYGREIFEEQYPNLDYDTYKEKSIVSRNKYFCLDSGKGGYYMVEKSTGDIFGIKSYGSINRKKFKGNAFEIHGMTLDPNYQP